MQLRHRLLALGVGGTVVTALVLVGVGAVESGRFGDEARTSVAGRRSMLVHFAVAAVLPALVVGLPAWWWARRVSGS